MQFFFSKRTHRDVKLFTSLLFNLKLIIEIVGNIRGRICLRDIRVPALIVKKGSKRCIPKKKNKKTKCGSVSAGFFPTFSHPRPLLFFISPTVTHTTAATGFIW